MNVHKPTTPNSEGVLLSTSAPHSHPAVLTWIGRVVGAGPVGLSVLEVILIRRTPPEVLQASSVPAPRRDLLIHMNFTPFRILRSSCSRAFIILQRSRR
jgi:hypothetical protein